VLHLSSSGIFCFPSGYPVSADIFLIFSSLSVFQLLCFRRQFLCMIELIQLTFLHFVFCRMFISSLTLFNTSSFFIWSVQTIFCILLQHYISKVSRQFRSISWSIQFNHHMKLCYKCSISLVSSSNLNLICWSTGIFFLLNAALPWQSWIWFHAYTQHHMLSGYPNSWNIPHSPVVFDLS